MKRFVCLFLCLVLLTGVLPVTVQADTNPVPKANQAVVTIVSGIVYENGTPYKLDRYASQGTGFGISVPGKDAQIFATNCHVVSLTDGDDMIPYDFVYVFVDGADIFDEKSVVRCEVLYADPDVDLAIIKAEAPIPGVKTLPICSAENIPVGESVFALGYPGVADVLADSNNYTVEDITVTNGVVSRHLVSNGTKCMAHTASVNHGNSGGPLINGKGQVVGINTFIYTDVQNADKRNYAIYSDYIMEAMDELDLPYEKSGQSGLPILPIGVGVVILAAALIAGILALRKRGKKTKVTIYALRGPLAGRSWLLESELTIGRDPSRSIVLPGDTKGVSRSHCVIRLLSGVPYVTDLNSSYGTFLNGQKLSPGMDVPLTSNCVISLADDSVQFSVMIG